MMLIYTVVCFVILALFMPTFFLAYSMPEMPRQIIDVKELTRQDIGVRKLASKNWRQKIGVKELASNN